MKKVDMSEEAILRRLKTVDQLRTLCLSLRRAKKESDAKAGKFKSSTTENNFDRTENREKQIPQDR
jgi:hypothetical protein